MLTADERHYKLHLRELRRASGMSQAILAKILGVSRYSILRWESLKSGIMPTRSHQKRVREFFQDTED